MRAGTYSDTRNSKQVLDKIKRMEETFWSVHAFATSKTGAGIEQAQCQETFQDLVRRECFHYYDFVDIMADRSGTEPRITSRDTSSLDIFQMKSNSKSKRSQIIRRTQKSQGTMRRTGLLAALKMTMMTNPSKLFIQCCPVIVLPRQQPVLTKRGKEEKNRITRLWMKTPSNCLESPTNSEAKMADEVRHNK
jgi:hypothetical protein